MPTASMGPEASREELDREIAASVVSYAPYIQRISQLAAPDGRLHFLNKFAKRAPFYSEVPVDSGTGDWRVALRQFPVATRMQRGLDPGAFVVKDAAEGAPLFRKFTSGTSGVTLEILLDSPTYFYLKDGAVGDTAHATQSALQRMTPGKVGVVIVRTGRHSRLTIPSITLKGALIRRLVIGRAKEEDVSVVSELRHSPPPILNAATGVLMQLADLDRALGGRRIQPGAVVASGEALFESERVLIQDWFQSEIVDCYASSEGGVLAIQRGTCRSFELVSRHSVLEVRREDGSIGDSGVGEFLVTSFLNRVMPVVRYATGDYGALGVASCRCGYRGQMVTDMRGREARALVAVSGAQIDPRVLDSLLLRWPFCRFQVVQAENTDILLRYAPDASADVSESIDGARFDIQSVLGAVRVAVERFGPYSTPVAKNQRYLRSDASGAQAHT